MTKLLEIQPAVDSFGWLGHPTSLAQGTEALELACLSSYLLPRTAVEGSYHWFWAGQFRRTCAQETR